MPSFLRSRRLLPLAAFMALALLFAQWMGLQHRVEHADWQQHPLAALDGIDHHDDHHHATDSSVDAHTHSCALYDGITLADSATVDIGLPPLLVHADTSDVLPAPASWEVPFALHFSTRAPPSV